jgi:hypothetical protein
MYGKKIENLRCQRGDMQQDPYWGPTNIGRPLQNFVVRKTRAAGICAPLAKNYLLLHKTKEDVVGFAHHQQNI